jgi:hypothetical protein
VFFTLSAIIPYEEVVRYFGDSGQLTNPPAGVAAYDIWHIDDQHNDARVAYSAVETPWGNPVGSPSWWWLRSPAGISSAAAIVDDDGLVQVNGIFVFGSGGVRPALWLNLQSEIP